MLSKFRVVTSFIIKCHKNTLHTLFRTFPKNLLESVQTEKVSKWLLQSVTGITEYDKGLIQSVAGVTKCDNHCRVRHNKVVNLIATFFLVPTPSISHFL